MWAGVISNADLEEFQKEARFPPCLRETRLHFYLGFVPNQQDPSFHSVKHLLPKSGAMRTFAFLSNPHLS